MGKFPSRSSRVPGRATSVVRMDVRIGIAESSQIIEIELENDADRDALKAEVAAVVTGKADSLWLTDRKGKELAIPASRIAFVEIGTADAERRIGFGA